MDSIEAMTTEIQTPLTPSEITEKPSTSKDWRIILITVVITLLTFGGFIVYQVRQTKTKVKDLTQEQIANCTKLQETYSKILEVVQSIPKEETNNTMLLGERTPETLGIEETAEMQQMRQLQELYRSAKETANKISETKAKFKKQTEALLASFFLPDSSSLVNKTEEFTKDSIGLLSYLEESNKIEIDAFTWGIEIGAAINEAITRGADETSIVKLEKNMDKLDELYETVAAMDTSALSQELQDDHAQSLKEFDEVKSPFLEILQSLKGKDSVALAKSLQSLAILSEVESDVSVVETVSFWQNDPTIRAVEEIKNNWEKFLQQL